MFPNQFFGGFSPTPWINSLTTQQQQQQQQLAMEQQRNVFPQSLGPFDHFLGHNQIRQGFQPSFNFHSQQNQMNMQNGWSNPFPHQFEQRDMQLQQQEQRLQQWQMEEERFRQAQQQQQQLQQQQQYQQQQYQQQQQQEEHFLQCSQMASAGMRATPADEASPGMSGQGPQTRNSMQMRSGDWNCRNCSNLNFAYRKVCNRCGLSKEENYSTSEPQTMSSFNQIEQAERKKTLLSTSLESDRRDSRDLRASEGHVHEENKRSEYQKLLEQEKQIENMFAQFESNLEKWKRDNADNPDKDFVRSQLEQMSAMRARILQRKEILVKKRENFFQTSTDADPSPKLNEERPSTSQGSSPFKKLATAPPAIPGLGDGTDEKPEESRDAPLTADDKERISKAVRDLRRGPSPSAEAEAARPQFSWRGKRDDVEGTHLFQRKSQIEASWHTELFDRQLQSDVNDLFQRRSSTWDSPRPSSSGTERTKVIDYGHRIDIDRGGVDRSPWRSSAGRASSPSRRRRDVDERRDPRGLHADRDRESQRGEDRDAAKAAGRRSAASKERGGGDDGRRRYGDRSQDARSRQDSRSRGSELESRQMNTRRDRQEDPFKAVREKYEARCTSESGRENEARAFFPSLPTPVHHELHQHQGPNVGGGEERKRTSDSGPFAYATPPKQSRPSIAAIAVQDLLEPPARHNRPPKFVVIIRGLPGSGKSFVAKSLKSVETEMGGEPPRILALDDYFLCDGQYEYEAEMEPSYRQSLIKSFKKQIDDGYFNFIIVDSVNEKNGYYEEMWSYAKQNGFEVYIAETDCDPGLCATRNEHNRTADEINAIFNVWEDTPEHMNRLDLRGFLQDKEIVEITMEDAKSSELDPNEDEEAEDIDDAKGPLLSKWEVTDTEEKMAQLDGVTEKALKKHAHHDSIEDWLELSRCSGDARHDANGKKRVRWADIEERQTQMRMRDVGFVVGHTNWNRMMDPTEGGSALATTKLIPNRFDSDLR